MRLISILTAILVTAGLYMAVMERDALLAFAGVEATTEDAETATATDAVAQTETPATDTRMGVVVTRSVASEIDSAVVLRGETRALRQVEVRAETNAVVISDPLRKGAMVAKGDLLCELDPGTREADLARARAALSEAQSRVPEAEARLAEANARLSEAQINNNAAERLIEDGFASETRLISSRAAVRSAEAAIASAKSGLEATQAGIEAAAASVAQATREIDRLTIEAPFDGLLESDTAELGSLMQPGGLCATVIELSQIKLVGYVPETDISRIQMGAYAGARLATGQEVAGFVTFISRSADPTTRTFEVEILVGNENLAIRDGQTAEILITAPGAAAHLLPQSSLTLNNDGLLGVRTVDENEIVRFVPVTLLRDTVEGVWVAGLPQQADVIVKGQDFVVDGVSVRTTMLEATE